MSDMAAAIERATAVVTRTRAFQAAAAFGVPEGSHRECAEYIVRALAEAGLLSVPPEGEVAEGAAREWIAIPADRVHEEWTSASDGDAWTCCGDRDEAEMRQYALRHGHELVRRLVTDWEPADRPDDDGADQ